MIRARLVEGALLVLGVADLMVLNLHLAPELGAAPAGRVAIAAVRSAPAAPAPSPDPAGALTTSAAAEVPEAPARAPAEVPRSKATGDIRFGLDAVRIDSVPALRELGRVARELEAHPERRVLVRGHSDRMGTPAYNLALSRRRALAVSGVLVVHGIARERIDVEALGQDEPLAAGDTPAAWAENRRVEIFWR